MQRNAAITYPSRVGLSRLARVGRHHILGSDQDSKDRKIRNAARSLLLTVVLLAGATIAVLWLLTDAVGPRADGFVRAEGQGLVRNGTPVRLKAVAFSNYYTMDIGEEDFDLATSRHHSEQDFERVRDMGFNAVRFAFNGNWHERDPDMFWRWLDQNIAWAKHHDMLLILDLHVPIGGFWLAPTSPKVDFSLWRDETLRQKSIDLWRAIAERYRDETVIAGFEILNEAVTTDATGAEWERFARAMVAAIREVNPNHLLIVGALYGTERKYEELTEASFFLLDDPNVMYDFHFYKPIEYTHQNSFWVDVPLGDGGTYPDAITPIPTGDQVFIDGTSIGTPRLPEGDTGWATFDSGWMSLDAADAVAGLPVATLRAGASGTIRFDDLAVFEYDNATGTVSRLLTDPLDPTSVWQWWEWHSPEEQPAPATFTRADTDGANDSSSLTVNGVTAPGERLGWSSDGQWFQATPGNLYRVTGAMAGTGVRYAPSAEGDPGYIGWELNFYAEPEDARGFHFRNQDYLRAEFRKLLRFGERHEVPMSVMEFGLVRDTFEIEGRGGDRWIADMLEIFDDHDVSFSLWNWHGPSMALNTGDYGEEPPTPNTPFIEVVQETLADQEG